MIFGQLLGLVGLILALIGSIKLAVRVFRPLVPLKDITDTNYQEGLAVISRHLNTAGDFNRAFNTLIRLLSTLIADLETTETDSFKRAKYGMGFLIAGAVFQALAIVWVLLTSS